MDIRLAEDGFWWSRTRRPPAGALKRKRPYSPPMRATLFAAALLLFTALTVAAPSASATDMRCPGWTMAFDTPAGSVTLYREDICGVGLYVHEDRECGGGDDHWVGLGNQPNHYGVWVKTCGDPTEPPL